MQIQARINHPALIHQDTMQALWALKASVEHKGVSAATLALIELRASQINGCGACVDMHAKMARKAGESDERLFAVAAWREAPYFDASERAALALAEALTRISDRPDAVSDEVWDEAARHYDEAALAALVVAIANINVWNRLNVAVRQPVGAWKG
ncbi:carboxymuconolactone decarboxylase family protein [Lysobacter sp. BMK333-48F3]|uniref:carboxymuconolactone decarboxylase family protein n=1 Tax=Lysobacter sp. BMK333-48F3 TaxID=2867962 RepID=UPI001C8B5A47|nr:carboxymuconolactone decarboxylase family protein [Lysobacter sp. BMK333-48F3]MBX9402266.1 carboxymuconolactone decarboxylase family protein [Lysobacter sp. BMK333-48F3]